MKLIPITQREARVFIEKHHRHHAPSRGGKFSIAVALDDEIVGVAMAGRPVSRLMDDGFTLEVNRVCTDGTTNACSNTMSGESGASLRGAGWRLVTETEGGNWNKAGRPRVDTELHQRKFRWEAE